MGLKKVVEMAALGYTVPEEDHVTLMANGVIPVLMNILCLNPIHSKP